MAFPASNGDRTPRAKVSLFRWTATLGAALITTTIYAQEINRDATGRIVEMQSAVRDAVRTYDAEGRVALVENATPEGSVWTERYVYDSSDFPVVRAVGYSAAEVASALRKLGLNSEGDLARTTESQGNDSTKERRLKTSPLGTVWTEVNLEPTQSSWVEREHIQLLGEELEVTRYQTESGYVLKDSWGGSRTLTIDDGSTVVSDETGRLLEFVMNEARELKEVFVADSYSITYDSIGLPSLKNLRTGEIVFGTHSRSKTAEEFLPSLRVVIPGVAENILAVLSDQTTNNELSVVATMGGEIYALQPLLGGELQRRHYITSSDYVDFTDREITIHLEARERGVLPFAKIFEVTIFRTDSEEVAILPAPPHLREVKARKRSAATTKSGAVFYDSMEVVGNYYVFAAMSHGTPPNPSRRVPGTPPGPNPIQKNDVPIGGGGQLSKLAAAKALAKSKLENVPACAALFNAWQSNIPNVDPADGINSLMNFRYQANLPHNASMQPGPWPNGANVILGPAFFNTNNQGRAVTIIHELLHMYGHGEYNATYTPDEPTSQEIQDMVNDACF